MYRASLLALMIVGSSLFGQVAADRPKPPDQAAAATAHAAAQSVFGSQIEKAKTAAVKKEVAERILAAANDAKESPANRWVLYAMARDLFASAGEMAQAMKILEEQSNKFAVTRLELVAESGEKLGKFATAANSKPLLDVLYAEAEDAVEADDFKMAIRLLGIGLNVARKNTKDEATVHRFDVQLKNSVELQKLFHDAKTEEERGKLYCFRKGDWARGLPILAKSKNESLAAVVKKDMKNPTEAQDRVDLGDAWFELTEKGLSEIRLGILRRAYWWYRLGVERMAGLAKAKVEERMSKILVETDAADIKQGRYTSIEGKWSALYKDGRTWDYAISSTGEAVMSNSGDLDGTKGFAKRINGVLVLVWANGSCIEKCSPNGATLILERYWPVDYPKKSHSSGKAVYKP